MFKFIISALYLLLYLILPLPLELVLFIIGKLNMPLRDKISFFFVKYIGLGVVTKMSGSRVIVNGLENIPDETACLSVCKFVPVPLSVPENSIPNPASRMQTATNRK